jgi:hypothetical protein
MADREDFMAVFFERRCRREILSQATYRAAGEFFLWGMLVAAVAGCQHETAATEEPAHVVQVPEIQAAQIGKGAELESGAEKRSSKSDNPNQSVGKSKSDDPSNSNSPIPNGAEPKVGKHGAGPALRPLSGSFDRHDALERIRAETADALDLRKTLVVWMVEQTPASSSLTSGLADELVRMLDSFGGDPIQPEMAVIGYADDASLLTQQPTSDSAKLRQAVGGLSKKKGDKGNPGPALKLAIDRFLDQQGRGFELIFVIVGASGGEDSKTIDESLIALRRAAVPVFGIGPKIAFGNSLTSRGPRRGQGNTNDQVQTSESVEPERIPLALSGGQSSADLTDSGYGPFGLERICRRSGGKFLRLHGERPSGWEINSETGDAKSELLAKYAPDYVNSEQYQKLLSENKCRMALHNAALFPPTFGLEPTVRLNFPKEKDEAAMARDIGTAQRAAADQDQPLQRLYDTLVAGEKERANLTGARWQAAYDLAMGQTLAAKSRLDGYNAILATIKQGKNFANADSTRWVLEPAEEVAVSSVLDKMAKNSRTYLKRVVQEHPGTPWAELAKRELRYPAGWKLVEK